jgi:hypothetical protein
MKRTKKIVEKIASFDFLPCYRLEGIGIISKYFFKPGKADLQVFATNFFNNLSDDVIGSWHGA